MPSHRLRVGVAGRGTHCYQKLQFLVSNLPSVLVLILGEASWEEVGAALFLPSYTRTPPCYQGTYRSALPWSF